MNTTPQQRTPGRGRSERPRRTPAVFVRLVSVTLFGLMVVTSCRGDSRQSVIVSPAAVEADTTVDTTAPSATGVVDSSGAAQNATEGETTTIEVTDSVPEVGTPGLDSTDAFCAGWSAWAGSVQVIAVTANFSDPSTVPSLEVAASPTMVGGYDAMLANWPQAITDARDLGANTYFGPMYFRSSEALAALTEVGADQTTIDSIQAAWYAALSQRDPSTPEISIDLPDATWDVVDAAAQLYSSRVPTLLEDDNLVITANTDVIDNYIAETCPDRGTLGGLDVDESG